MPKIPVAVQMYTLRNDLDSDFAGTVAEVAKIGYKTVELAGYHGHTAEDVKKILDDNGLSVMSTHVPIETLQSDPQRVIDEHLLLGATYVVVPYIGNELRGDYRALAAVLNKIGANVAPHGLTVCYHNHDFEFKTENGEIGYDVLFGAANPNQVKIEMDTFWVTKGGYSPVEYLEKYKGRVPLVHLKDMTPEGDFAPVGTGTIDYKTLIPAAEAAGAELYVVEQDVCKTDTPLGSIRTSFENLKAMGVA